MGRRKRLGVCGKSRREDASRSAFFGPSSPRSNAPLRGDAFPRALSPRSSRLYPPPRDWHRQTPFVPGGPGMPPYAERRFSPRRDAHAFEGGHSSREARHFLPQGPDDRGVQRRVVLLPAPEQRPPLPGPYLQNPPPFSRPPQQNGSEFEGRSSRRGRECDHPRASPEADYVVCDLSHYKKLQVPLRVRTPAEIAAGIGVRVCGALGCTTVEKQRRLQATLCQYKRELDQLEKAESTASEHRRLQERVDSTREAYARASRDVQRLTERAREAAAEARSAAFAAEAAERKNGPLAAAAAKAAAEAREAEAQAEASRREAEGRAAEYREAENALLKQRQVVDLTGSSRRLRKERQVGILQQQLALMQQLRTYKLQGKFEEGGQVVQREVKCCVCASCAFKLNYEQLLKQHQIEEWRHQFSALQEREQELERKLRLLNETPGRAKNTRKKKTKRRGRKAAFHSEKSAGSPHSGSIERSSCSVEVCDGNAATSGNSNSREPELPTDGISPKGQAGSAKDGASPVVVHDPSISRSVSCSPSCSISRSRSPRERSISRSVTVSDSE